jgi:hypothetical protein
METWDNTTNIFQPSFDKKRRVVTEAALSRVLETQWRGLASGATPLTAAEDRAYSVQEGRYIEARAKHGEGRA